MERPSLDETYVEIAKVMAKRSTCARKKVGAILVKDGKIISCGYNGTPSKYKVECTDHFHELAKSNNLDFEKWKDTKEFYDLHGSFSKDFEVHSETNVLLYVSKEQSNGSTLYVTLSPCSDCAKLIVQSGIKRVVYVEDYDRDPRGLLLIKEMGIECVKYK